MMENSIEYLNNYNYNKIEWDNTIELYTNVSKSQLQDTVLYTLDTENTNHKNERCITYATQLMEFGIHKHKDNKYKFINKEDRKMLLFTHPDNFWEYIHNIPNQRLLFYVFNAEYDVNNLLNFAIRKYDLIEAVADIEEVEEYDDMYVQKNSFLTTSDSYVYSKISRNGKIYKCDIQLGTIRSGKTKGIKKITIIDMSKKTTGTLKSNVESFTSLKMNKDDLDYSVYRDYGHKNYLDEELLYMWNDVYCLADFTIEYVYSGKYKHTDKLTTSSMALMNYKDELQEDIINAINNTSHKLHKIALKMYKVIERTKLKYMLLNKDNGKYKKLFEEYQNYLWKYKGSNKEFIIDKYFTPKEVFDFIFPKLNYEEFDYCKNSYCGGITRFSNKKTVGKWINKKGMGIDINSSFPYSYTHFKLPYDVGNKIDLRVNKMKKSKLYILRFKVNTFSIKKDKEPNISKVMINLNKGSKKDMETWVKENNTTCIINCTSIDYEYFIKNYNYTGLELLDGMEFNCLQGFFDKFTNKFYPMKSQKGVSKGIRSWVKLILNGVYGKFGQNKSSEMRLDVYNKNTNSIDDVIARKDDDVINLLSDGVYLPLASFVTSYSRLHLLKVLNKINSTKGIQWEYCDTDSAYVTGNVDILKEALKEYIDFDNTGQLGLWKIEKYFDKILIIGIKKYIYYGNEIENKDYSYHCTLSGINRKYFKFIEEYCNIDENCICENIGEHEEYIKKINNNETSYYVSENKDNPFIYKNRECTEIIKGAYQSIRKKTVIDGQILYGTIYCIKGDIA